ncbi:DUF7230 family protein [Vibrio parahaemolyticus]
MAKSKTSAKVCNSVAKHARTFNLSHVFVDRKKREKSGYSKHKAMNAY